MARWCVALALLLSGPSAGCLPGDTRPVPGSLYVTAEPGVTNSDGFSTADGWHVSFDRLLMGLGSLGINGDGCNDYSEPRYERLFDFVRGGPQKLGIMYGLGTCDLEFRLRSPDSNALLAEGVTASDLAFMRISASDFYTEDARIAAYIVGTATSGQTKKHFAWAFRERYELRKCAALPGGTSGEIAIHGEDKLQAAIVVTGQELFRLAVEDGSALRFEPLAEADENADGEITFEELAKVTAPPVESDGGVELPDAGDGADAGAATLQDRIYETLVPRMLRLAGGGPCEAEARPPRRQF